MMETFTGPYIRIIPMHFTIMAGAIVIGILGIIGIESAVPVLVLFLLLKTAADIATHLHKHPGFRKSGTYPMRQEA
jgi:predicted RND superfamily exporter protein